MDPKKLVIAPLLPAYYGSLMDSPIRSYQAPTDKPDFSWSYKMRLQRDLLELLAEGSWFHLASINLTLEEIYLQISIAVFQPC
jgi:hypothetical protein